MRRSILAVGLGILATISPVFAQPSLSAELTGRVVNETQDPQCGCIVSLVKAGTADTTEQGSFRLAGLPSGSIPSLAGVKQQRFSIDLFSLNGRRVGHLAGEKMPLGKLSRIFPAATTSGVYVMAYRQGGYTTRYTFFSTGNEPFGAIVRPIIDRTTRLLREAALQAAGDTLIIRCPNVPARKIHITSYSGDLGQIMVAAAPAQAVSEVVFAVRTNNPTGDGHWYANFGYYGYNSSNKAYGSGGQLCKLNLSTGKLTLLLSDAAGSVRDPQVSYEGTNILFSYRKGGSEYYNLYEINVDGSGLRQLTSGAYDDIEPTYLPDGGIAFCSSRARRYVNCWVVQVATVYRCDKDGKNIRMLSANIEQDNTPWMLPDGYLLYTRWEYVDRSQMRYHHLWKMFPDGRQQMVYFGNYHPDNVMIDAKPIPGTNPLRVVMVHSYGHGAVEHEGDIALLRTDQGPDVASAEKIISAGNGFRDPYPLSPDSFLVARGTSLMLMDSSGKYSALFELSSTLSANNARLHEPRPIISREREPALASGVNLADSSGKLLVLDTYLGRNMAGLARGEIKKLLILETLPKPVNFTGQQEPLSLGGTFTLNRVIGTVPVESDGSCYMELPANRSFFFVALDSNDRSVKRMQSFLSVVPGENTSCIGCHEDRTMVTPNLPQRLAMKHAAYRPEPIANMPQVFDYPRDIQPIWNRHCLACHDVDKRSGGVLMTGDLGPIYSHSYFELSSRLQIADGRNQRRSEYSPRTLGSSASPLLKKIDGTHHDVALTAEEFRTVTLWIDASANYPGTYAALGSGMIGRPIANSQDHSDKSWPAVSAIKDVISRRCASCHKDKTRLPEYPSDDLGLPPYGLAYNGGSAGWDADFPTPWTYTSREVKLSEWRVTDGIIGLWNSGEWGSNGETNPWVQLSWPTAQTISKVVIYDRVNLDDWARGGQLLFSDGSEVIFTGIANEGTARELTFPSRSVTWVKFQVQNGTGLNVGLSEFEVYGGSGENLAPAASVSASSTSGFDPASDYATNVGSQAWMKKYADARLPFYREIVFNLSRPEKSVLLLAPLAAAAGGYGICPNVFASTSDPDYQLVLNGIKEAKSRLDQMTRFSMPNFRPDPAYVQEMKHFGILPLSQSATDPIDVYKTDSLYWISHWYKPVPVSTATKTVGPLGE
jgi:hypothetical protein